MSQGDLFQSGIPAPTFAYLPARALTLWQPWAWLVANGHKDLENRPIGFSHKSIRGQFWIHAGLQHATDLPVGYAMSSASRSRC